MMSLPAAAQVPVRHQEGTLHGFLALRDQSDKLLASGDLVQVAQGDRITLRLAFHFKDGSLQEDTAIFTQHRTFHLISDHLVQKGPSFPHPLDLLIDTSKGLVTVRYTSDNHQEQVKSEHMNLPPDLANGMTPTLLKNIAQNGDTKLSLVVASPKPRIVKLAISAQGEDSFVVEGEEHKAMHFVVKIEPGGLAGVVAPLIGKQPPDMHVWVVGGKAPAFVKSEGQLYPDGPIWKIEIASPTWPKEKSGEQ